VWLIELKSFIGKGPLFQKSSVCHVLLMLLMSRAINLRDVSGV